MAQGSFHGLTILGCTREWGVQPGGAGFRAQQGCGCELGFCCALSGAESVQRSPFGIVLASPSSALSGRSWTPPFRSNCPSHWQC